MRNASLTVYRKELADYFSSNIFIILLALIYIAGLGFAYISIQSIKSAPTSTDQSLLMQVFVDEFIYLKLFTVGQIVNFNFISFLAIFIPLIGILFGFNAISSEKNSGNLSRILAQPIYRDSVINGKFLAGITTLTIMISSIVFVMIGIGIRAIGIPPNSEEILRILIFIIICVIDGAFWMSFAILFSIISKNIVGSILTSIPIWLFFVFFWGMIAKAIADVIVPTGSQSTNDEIIRNTNIFLNLQRISPQFLFIEAAIILINPSLGYTMIRGFTSNSLADIQNQRMLFNPISVSQSMVQIWPQLVILIALALICFGISYIIFMRQEIRSG